MQAHLISATVPADLEYAAGALVAVYQLAALRAPDVHALVEAAARQELAVGGEGDAVDGLLVAGERVHARAALHVPQPHRRVEAGGGEDEVHVGVVGAGAGGAPLDRVDLLLVSLEVVHAVVSVHCPHFQCHVIAARCQKFALRVPFDGIHLIRVTLFTKHE